MKHSIQISENELKKMIHNIINEVKYGGETLHGDNMGDWDAIGKVRRSKGGKGSVPAWDLSKNRNHKNKSDVFRKKYGKYETSKPSVYQFPDEETYNTASDEIANSVETGFDKWKNIMKNSAQDEITVLRKWFENGETLYAKKAQGNGFYPIYKYEPTSNGDGYQSFSERINPNGERYWKPGGIYNNFDELLGLFTTFSYLISKEPLTNDKEYDGEGNRVIDTTYFQTKNDSETIENKLEEAISRTIRKYLR